MRVLLVVPLLLAGCVTELLADNEVTTRNITCTLLLQSQTEVVIRVDDTVGLALDVPLARAVAELADATGRDPATIRIVYAARWVPMEEWLEERSPLGRVLTLSVLVLDSLEPATRTVRVVAPGAMLLGADGIQEGTVEAGMEFEDVATGVILHGLGHMLGIVNRGIPIADENRTGREGPMHHEPQAGSIMHADWHHGSSLQAPDAFRYSDGIRRDWAAAKEGVCA